MEYPKNDTIQKRLKDLDSYISNAEASIKLYKENIIRAKKEKTQLGRITGIVKSDKSKENIQKIKKEKTQLDPIREVVKSDK